MAADKQLCQLVFDAIFDCDTKHGSGENLLSRIESIANKGRNESMSIHDIDLFKYNGKSIGFCRITDTIVVINESDVPDSDQCIVEDQRGYRYKRNIQLELGMHQYAEYRRNGFIFERV